MYTMWHIYNIQSHELIEKLYLHLFVMTPLVTHIYLEPFLNYFGGI